MFINAKIDYCQSVANLGYSQTGGANSQGRGTNLLEFSLNGAELSLNSVNSGNSENLRNSLKHELGSV